MNQRLLGGGSQGDPGLEGGEQWDPHRDDNAGDHGGGHKVRDEQQGENQTSGTKRRICGR